MQIDNIHISSSNGFMHRIMQKAGQVELRHAAVQDSDVLEALFRNWFQNSLGYPHTLNIATSLGGQNNHCMGPAVSPCPPVSEVRLAMLSKSVLCSPSFFFFLLLNKGESVFSEV